MVWLRAFFALILAVCSAALLSPWAWAATQFAGFAFPFSRVFDRVLLLAVVCLIFYYRTAFKINYSFNLKILRECATAITITLVIGFFILLSSPLNFNFDKTLPVTKLAKFALGAIATGIIEEWLFRGVLFSKLRTMTGVLAAAVLSSVFYAAVHFLKPIKSYLPEIADPFSGFVYVFHVLSQGYNMQLLWPFCGLVILGLMLVAIYIKSGHSLAYGIGLHAGLIIIMKFGNYFLVRDLVAEQSAVPKILYLISLPIGWVCVIMAGVGVLAAARGKKLESKT